ncbi:MAG: hypothetical protein K1000chlam2_00767 [Chlamydiae bacterium]|nr:hypothetical protein [Chlamydiota bacterium]
MVTPITSAIKSKENLDVEKTIILKFNQFYRLALIDFLF